MKLNTALKSNEGKLLVRESNGKKYARYAIKTHFVEVGDCLNKLIEEYVIPIYNQGDIVTIGEKIVSLCQGNVVYKKDIKISWLARFLSKFVVKTPYGQGVGNVYKMQLAIDLAGYFKIILGAIIAGFGKLFGVKGLFYKIVGKGVSNIDGFYDEEFEYYGDKGILAADEPAKVCQDIKDTYGIDCMIVDANDLGVEILGSNYEVINKQELIVNLLKDNPAGQENQQTPIILIREQQEGQKSTISA